MRDEPAGVSPIALRAEGDGTRAVTADGREFLFLSHAPEALRRAVDDGERALRLGATDALGADDVALLRQWLVLRELYRHVAHADPVSRLAHRAIGRRPAFDPDAPWFRDAVWEFVGPRLSGDEARTARVVAALLERDAHEVAAWRRRRVDFFERY